MDAFLQIPANVLAIKNSAFQALTDGVWERARQNATAGRSWNASTPYLFKRTGSLEASIQKTPYVQLGVGADGEQRIYTLHPGARINEEGGTITGRPWLTFRLYANPSESTPSGPWIRTRQVTIPARPFMNPAAQAGVNDWGQYVQEAMGRILGAL